ncbi:hypothetical protein QBC35DRAFT_454520 [Podospora australis]|uniref:Uncharacterized protein n=1 Tax=Podospora australis TaxID=1536484 RepID=A0AAN6WN24_9PEZI|nr:hypothetical protein QBC35DRAFT_454520 [Podospora australis]
MSPPADDSPKPSSSPSSSRLRLNPAAQSFQPPQLTLQPLQAPSGQAQQAPPHPAAFSVAPSTSGPPIYPNYQGPFYRSPYPVYQNPFYHPAYPSYQNPLFTSPHPNTGFSHTPFGSYPVAPGALLPASGQAQPGFHYPHQASGYHSSQAVGHQQPQPKTELDPVKQRSQHGSSSFPIAPSASESHHSQKKLEPSGFGAVADDENVYDDNHNEGRPGIDGIDTQKDDVSLSQQRSAHPQKGQGLQKNRDSRITSSDDEDKPLRISRSTSRAMTVAFGSFKQLEKAMAERMTPHQLASQLMMAIVDARTRFKNLSTDIQARNIDLYEDIIAIGDDLCTICQEFEKKKAKAAKTRKGRDESEKKESISSHVLNNLATAHKDAVLGIMQDLDELYQLMIPSLAKVPYPGDEEAKRHPTQKVKEQDIHLESSASPDHNDDTEADPSQWTKPGAAQCNTDQIKGSQPTTAALINAQLEAVKSMSGVKSKNKQADLEKNQSARSRPQKPASGANTASASPPVIGSSEPSESSNKKHNTRSNQRNKRPQDRDPMLQLTDEPSKKKGGASSKSSRGKGA